MDLPVHRPDGRTSGIVFALPDEINAWIDSHPSSKRSHESELAALRREVAIITSNDRTNFYAQRLNL